jgi:zinc protease
MTYEYYKLPPDYLQQIKTAVEKLTPEDIMAVAKRKLNPDNLQILVVGKAADFDEPLANLGQTKEIDITIPQPKSDQFAASDAELNKGKETLAKVAKACGGVATFKKVKSVSTDAKATINTPQGAMTLDISKVEVLPAMVAEIVKTPMGTQTVVFDGTSGWMMAGGKSMKMPSGQMDEQKKDASRNSVILFSKADQPDFKVADKGEADFEGKKAVRLDFLTADGSQFTMYLDPTSFLPSGMKYSGQTMAGPGEVIETYDAYKPFGGIMMPTKTVQKAGGMDVSVEIVKIDVNGKYDETLFKKPEGI